MKVEENFRKSEVYEGMTREGNDGAHKPNVCTY
jgi:hypothetical protein